MAVYSMTGYASAASGPLAAPPAAGHAEPVTPERADVTAEIRSVNARFLDLSLRLPDELRALEPQLRDLVAASLRRGKVELRLSTRASADDGLPQPQPEQLSRLARVQAMVHNWLPDAQGLTVDEALHWTRGSGAGAEELAEPALLAAQRALDALREARAREGERLAEALALRVATLRGLAAQAEPLLPEVVQRQQQRFVERWAEALRASGAAQSMPQEALQERALNEAAAFAIRIDVAEELARLRSHLDEIERLLAKGGEVGKRLDFLIQELLREANTLGSKSAVLALTSISVEMKVAIEQLREQVQNIE